MTKLDKQYTTVQSETYLCPILNISIFAVSSTSGSTLAPGAGAAGPVDNATPKGDNSNANGWR